MNTSTLDFEKACFVSHLECSETGSRIEADKLHGLSTSGAPLLVKYDLISVQNSFNKKELSHRPSNIWRYRELLPYKSTKDIISLGEMMTPLIEMPLTANKLGGESLLIKDEGRMPTASFKARGIALAVTMAKSFGIKKIAIPTAGNAGAALSAYAARAGIEAYVFTPEDTPEVTLKEIAFHGAKTFRVKGLIDSCGKVVNGGIDEMGWFDMSTLKEPYRIEGKKTMGFEIAEQLNWSLPDVIFYPTGGGTGIIAMWKAFKELKEIRWIQGPLPRMVAVQTTGCAPIVHAFESGFDSVPLPWNPVKTNVHGVRVPKPLGDRLILRTIRESEGFAIAVEDFEVEDSRIATAKETGFHLCPEGSACLVAYQKSLRKKMIRKTDQAVLFNCANGLKSPMPVQTLELDVSENIDYSKL